MVLIPASSLQLIWTSCCRGYMIIWCPPTSCERHICTQFNPSTVKIIPWSPDIFDRMHLLFTQVHFFFWQLGRGQYVTPVHVMVFGSHLDSYIASESTQRLISSDWRRECCLKSSGWSLEVPISLITSAYLTHQITILLIITCGAWLSETPTKFCSTPKMMCLRLSS